MNRGQQQPAAGGGNVLADAQAWLLSLPLNTRYLFVLFLGITLVGNLGLINAFKFVYIPTRIWNNFEIWRLVTPFFFEKLGLNFLVNLYFLYKNSLELETTLFAGRTADYTFFILFQMVALLLVGWYMNFILLADGLILSIIYLWAQFYRDRTVSFMFGFQFKATWFPFVLVAWDFFTAGVIPYPKIAGILTGHLYYFLDKVLPEQQGGRRYLNTPQFLRNIVPQPEVPRTAGFGSGGGVETFAPRTAEVADQGGARQRHSWGRGQRLGE